MVVLLEDGIDSKRLVYYGHCMANWDYTVRMYCIDGETV